MSQSKEEILIQQLQGEGERLTWAINSTVYSLEGSRFITWAKEGGGWGVAPLPPDYGPDHYEAAHSFLREKRVRREECLACSQVAQDVAKARELAGDMEAWGVADQVARFIRERLEG